MIGWRSEDIPLPREVNGDNTPYTTIDVFDRRIEVFRYVL
jgi:hypothetical protein